MDSSIFMQDERNEAIVQDKWPVPKNINDLLNDTDKIFSKAERECIAKHDCLTNPFSRPPLSSKEVTRDLVVPILLRCLEKFLTAHDIPGRLYRLNSVESDNNKFTIRVDFVTGDRKDLNIDINNFEKPLWIADGNGEGFWRLIGFYRSSFLSTLTIVAQLPIPTFEKKKEKVDVVDCLLKKNVDFALEHYPHDVYSDFEKCRGVLEEYYKAYEQELKDKEIKNGNPQSISKSFLPMWDPMGWIFYNKSETESREFEEIYKNAMEKIKKQRRIVCAANRLKDGTVILGIRHWDDFMHQAIGQSKNEDEEVETVVGHRQGFVDQWGNFVSRREAWDIALHQEQIVRTGPGFEGPDLYSENLY